MNIEKLINPSIIKLMSLRRPGMTPDISHTHYLLTGLKGNYICTYHTPYAQDRAIWRFIVTTVLFLHKVQILQKIKGQYREIFYHIYPNSTKQITDLYFFLFWSRVGLDKAGFISVLGEQPKTFLDMKVEKIPLICSPKSIIFGHNYICKYFVKIREWALGW